jgi:hypothetical protein
MNCKAPLAYIDKAGFVWPWGQTVPASFKSEVKWLCSSEEIEVAYVKMIKMMEDRKNDIGSDLPPEQREMVDGFATSARNAVLANT